MVVRCRSVALTGRSAFSVTGGSQCGLEFFDAGSADRSTEQVLELWLAAKGIDPLAYGGGHLAEPGVEDVENRLAGGLDNAFFKAFHETFLTTFLTAFLTAFLTTFDETFLDTFLKAFFKGEFFEEGDVGHGFFG